MSDYILYHAKHERARESALATLDWLLMLHTRTPEEEKLLEALKEFTTPKKEPGRECNDYTSTQREPDSKVG